MDKKVVWRVIYRVGNSYRIKCLFAESSEDAIKKAKVKDIVDLDMVGTMEV